MYLCYKIIIYHCDNYVSVTVTFIIPLVNLPFYIIFIFIIVVGLHSFFFARPLKYDHLVIGI